MIHFKAARGAAVLFRTGSNTCLKEDLQSAALSRCMSFWKLESLRGVNSNAVTHHRSPGLTLCHKCYSSGSIVGSSQRVGLVSKMKHALGMMDKPRYPRMKLNITGLKLYRSCAEFVDYEEFFEVFGMPDTFNSWFLVMELHVWLCMVRLAGESVEGKFVRNSMIESMWKDVQERVKLIGAGASPSYRRQSVDSLGAHFHFSLYSFDEGLLSDDRVLAGAIWRVILEKRDAEPGALALLVQYVRQQVQLLDSIDSEVLLKHGDLTFLPLIDENGKRLSYKKPADKS